MQKDPFADWQIHPVSKLVLVDPCCRCCSHRNHQDLTDSADKAKAVIQERWPMAMTSPGKIQVSMVGSHPIHPQMSGDSEDGEAIEGFGGGSESLGVHGPGPLEL